MKLEKLVEGLPIEIVDADSMKLDARSLFL